MTAEGVNTEALEALVNEDAAEVDAADEQVAEAEAFEAAFKGEEPKPAEAVAGEAAEPEAAAPVEEEPKPDDKLTKLEQRLRAAEGRNGTLNAQIKSLNERIEKLTTPAKPKEPTVSERLAAVMAGGEKLKALQSEFPEFAEALDEQAMLFGQAMEKHLAGMKAEASGDRVTRADTERMMKEARQLARLDMKYPDWEETCQTADFAEWYQRQDADTKALAQSDNAKDAMLLLDKYNENLTPTRKSDPMPAQDRLRSAIPATAGASRSISRQPSDEEDFASAFKATRG